jgi:hypothetical protein
LRRDNASVKCDSRFGSREQMKNNREGCDAVTCLDLESSPYIDARLL